MTSWRFKSDDATWQGLTPLGEMWIGRGSPPVWLMNTVASVEAEGSYYLIDGLFVDGRIGWGVARTRAIWSQDDAARAVREVEGILGKLFTSTHVRVYLWGSWVKAVDVA